LMCDNVCSLPSSMDVIWHELRLYTVLKVNRMNSGNTRTSNMILNRNHWNQKPE